MTGQNISVLSTHPRSALRWQLLQTCAWGQLAIYDVFRFTDIAAACKSVSLSSKNLAGAAHSWISLHLVGEQHGQVELLCELLQSTEELIEFLCYGSAVFTSG